MHSTVQQKPATEVSTKSDEIPFFRYIACSFWIRFGCRYEIFRHNLASVSEAIKKVRIAEH
jgi:hypothetical protein